MRIGFFRRVLWASPFEYCRQIFFSPRTDTGREGHSSGRAPAATTRKHIIINGLNRKFIRSQCFLLLRHRHDIVYT